MQIRYTCNVLTAEFDTIIRVVIQDGLIIEQATLQQGAFAGDRFFVGMDLEAILKYIGADERCPNGTAVEASGDGGKNWSTDHDLIRDYYARGARIQEYEAHMDELSRTGMFDAPF